MKNYCQHRFYGCRNMRKFASIFAEHLSWSNRLRSSQPCKAVTVKFWRNEIRNNNYRKYQIKLILVKTEDTKELQLDTCGMTFGTETFFSRWRNWWNKIIDYQN
jgi:hypothetical protein